MTPRQRSAGFLAALADLRPLHARENLFGQLTRRLNHFVRTAVGVACLLAATGFAAEPRLVTQPTAESTGVLDSAGRFWTWGSLAIAAPRAVVAPGVTRWITAAGGVRMLAVDQTGRLWSWGQAGVHFAAQPTLITNVTVRFREVAPTQGTRDFLLDEAGELWLIRFIGKAPAPGSTAFSDYIPGRVTDPRVVGGWKQIASGANHSLLLTGSGQLFATGENTMGQVSTQRTVGFHEGLMLVPPPAPHLHWQQVACGTDTSFGRASDGEWYWWGALASPTTNRVVKTASHLPARLHRPREVNAWQQIAAGDDFILLLSDGGRVYGLGDNLFGTLGYPDQNAWALSYTNLPRRLFAVGPQTNRVATVGAGRHHGLALDERGELYTWGSNAAGQLGRPVAGSDWQPARVPGDQLPFSPAAEAWPQLEWVPIQPRLQAPVLAGQPGQSARFELHRRSGPAVAIPLRFRSSVGGLSFGGVRTKLNGVDHTFSTGNFTLGATNSLVVVEFTPSLSPLPSVFRQVELFATSSIWVDWIGPSSTPLEIDIPTQWSEPPRFQSWAGGTIQWGSTNILTVRAVDDDGWPESVEITATDRARGSQKRVGEFRFPRTLAGTPAELRIPWFAGAPEFPLGSEVDISAVLKDNAGSVIVGSFKFTLAAHGWDSLASRFRASWVNSGLLVSLPELPRVKLEDSGSGEGVEEASVRIHSWPVSRVSFTKVPGEADVLPAPPGTLSAMVQIKVWGQFLNLPLPVLWIQAPDAPPAVYIEALDPDAYEGTGDSGMFRLARFGGNLGEPLAVRLWQGWDDGFTIPFPRNPIMFLSRVDPQRDCIGFPEKSDIGELTVTIPAGQTDLLIPVAPRNNDQFEGNKGLTLVVSEAPGRYSLITALGNPPVNTSVARVILHDDEHAELPKVTILSPRTGQSFAPGEQITVKTGELPDSRLTIIQRQLYLDGADLGATNKLPTLLPVGPLTLRAKVTDSFGQEGWSEPVTVHVTPGLKLQSRQANADGTELWELAAEPLFQDLRLESAPEIGQWQPLRDWRPSPTNRTQTITVPTGTDARFLRLVPAHEE